MIPFKKKTKGILKNTTVFIILICLTETSVGFLQVNSRRNEVSPKTRTNGLLDGPTDFQRNDDRRYFNKERSNVDFRRESNEIRSYIRDVGADSRQSRIASRDIRTDFREIRTELRDINNNQQRRMSEYRTADTNTRQTSPSRDRRNLDHRFEQQINLREQDILSRVIAVTRDRSSPDINVRGNTRTRSFRDSVQNDNRQNIHERRSREDTRNNRLQEAITTRNRSNKVPFRADEKLTRDNAMNQNDRTRRHDHRDERHDIRTNINRVGERTISTRLRTNGESYRADEKLTRDRDNAMSRNDQTRRHNHRDERRDIRTSINREGDRTITTRHRTNRESYRADEKLTRDRDNAMNDQTRRHNHRGERRDIRTSINREGERSITTRDRTNRESNRVVNRDRDNLMNRNDQIWRQNHRDERRDIRTNINREIGERRVVERRLMTKENRDRNDDRRESPENDRRSGTLMRQMETRITRDSRREVLLEANIIEERRELNVPESQVSRRYSNRDTRFEGFIATDRNPKITTSRGWRENSYNKEENLSSRSHELLTRNADSTINSQLKAESDALNNTVKILLLTILIAQLFAASSKSSKFRFPNLFGFSNKIKVQ